MEKIKLSILGVPDPSATDSLVDVGPLTGIFRSRPTCKAAYRFQAVRGGEQIDKHALDVEEDDLVEVGYGDGSKRWMSVARLSSDFAFEPSRGSSEHVVTADSFAGSAERGIVKTSVEGLKLIGFDLAGLAGRELAQFIGEQIESRLVAEEGVYRLLYKETRGDGLDLRLDSKIDHMPSSGSKPKPILVFVHGTVSNFSGCFGALSRASTADPKERDWASQRIKRLKHLLERYDDRVYCLQHRTLTKSPAENAIQLLDALPNEAQLHLVTHSRGGLVGELLCRGQIGKEGRGRHDDASSDHPDRFRQDELEAYGRDNAPGRPQQVHDLERLGQMLIDKRPFVERFVRVACPARGTTLADGKLDDWLSGFASLTERFIPVIGESDLYYVLKALTLAVIKQKADASVLPGLEAMMTDSPLIRLLNTGPRLNADLSVIAGDTDAAGWIPWMWPVDRFFEHERFPEGRNDLIVPTRSMTMGHPREPGCERVFEDRGSSVNHFSYFRNRATFDRLIAALERSEGEHAGFEPRRRAVPSRAPRAARVARADGKRPHVILIPGISGSHIKIEKDRIWLQFHEIVFGQLAKLNLGKSDLDQVGTGPDGIIDRYYGDLADYLDATHEVIEFDYDWRLSLSDNANRLDEEIRKRHLHRLPTGPDQPVRILAHSMGGLVARAWVSLENTSWETISKHPGSRIVMLGTPTLGSFAIPRLLMGRDALIKSLARWDLKNDANDLLEVFNRFPGILSLLPRLPAEQGLSGSEQSQKFDFTAVDTWKRLKLADHGNAWPLPNEEDLNGLKDDWTPVDEGLDPDRMLYVAGHAPATVSNLQIQPESGHSRVVFEATTKGDGRVTWESGIPSTLEERHKVWYMPVEHGDLCRYKPGFPALYDLLQTGATEKLSKSPPAIRAPQRSFPLPDDQVVFFPDEEMVLDAAIGARSEPRAPGVGPAADVPIVRVSVIHGDLHHKTGQPIVVGHYLGDTLVSAEAQLDRKLGGRLSELRDLQVYPGLLNTSEVMLEGDSGAIVVGLGNVGELSVGALRRTLRQALVRYARSVSENQRLRAKSESVAHHGIPIVSLLLGTGTGGVTVVESIRALLDAVRDANEALAQLDADSERTGLAARIASIELLELYEDLAIAAAKALQRLSEDPGYGTSFVFESEVHHERGGCRRGHMEEPPGWWRPVQVLTEKDGSLRYATPTDKARIEVKLQPTQRRLIDVLVDESTRLAARDRELEQTLFELLLPNELKDHVHEQRDLVLMLDAQTARYPWEMLNDNRDEQLGADKNKPMSTLQGCVRQLYTTRYRQRPTLATNLNALVIGDPPSAFPELHGAQDEARSVAEKLRSAGFRIKDLIAEENASMSALKALFADDYRVVHLAGHGVYQYKSKAEAHYDDDVDAESRSTEEVTGMVLGDGVYLTVKEVEQMRVVPELVFINCCSLGRIEPEVRTQQPHYLFDGRPTLAANLATQFMRMGARAVVAAGWEVQDDAAQCFASTFYQSLLSGDTFGGAVKRARREVFEHHDQTNTWGAYQCYGDPAYRLIRGGGGREQGQKVPVYVSPSEPLIELQNLRSSAKQGSDEEHKRTQLARLESVVSRIPNGWFEDNSALQQALAGAYAELKQFEQALRWYDKTIACAEPRKDAEYPGKAIDQRANVRARYGERVGSEAAALAGADLKDAAQDRQKTAENLIQNAIRDLEYITKIQPSAERYGLLGAAQKRLAQLSLLNGSKVDTALKNCAKAYMEATCYTKEQSGHHDPYSAINALVVMQIVIWRGLRLPKLKCSLTKLHTDLKEHLAGLEAKDFWERTYPADLNLVEHMIEDTLDEHREADVAGYKNLLENASPRERDSVLNQLRFIAAFAEDKHGESVEAILERLNE